MNILQLTVHFEPNIGGVETHLDDLIKILIKKKFKVAVLSYRPLETKAEWNLYEQRKNLQIIRLPLIPGLFYKFAKNPVLEFLYLTPILLFSTPFVIFFYSIEVIHAHGLISGFVGVFWGKILNKRVIVSIHNIYNFPDKGLYKSCVSWILKNSDNVLALSQGAINGVKALGLSSEKVKRFTYWIDLNKFRKIDNAKKLLKWENKLVVLFVGRLVEEKGLLQLLESAKTWNKMINLAIVGIGPLTKTVMETANQFSSIKFYGAKNSSQLPIYYSAADVVIVPSTSEEGFGRVILEALACGTPILGSTKGAIKEAMDESVGLFINPTRQEIKKNVEYLLENKNVLKRLSRKTREFVKKSILREMLKQSSKHIQGKLKQVLATTGDMALKRRAKNIIEGLDLKDGDKVLEVGCGNGYYLSLLNRLGIKLKLTGIDNVQLALDDAKRFIADKKVKLIYADAARLPFLSSTFDKIVMSEVVEHVNDERAVLKEAYRVLKPGGVFILTTCNINYPFLWDPINWFLQHLFNTHIKSGFWAGIWNQHLRMYDKKEVEKLIKSTGFNLFQSENLTNWCLPFNHYLVNLIAIVIAKLFYSGKIPMKFSGGIIKFRNEQQNPLVKLVFIFINFYDKLNDLMPGHNGVSVFVKAIK